MICDLLIYNALLLTMEPGSQPWYQGYVAIQGGKIAAVGQAESRQSLPPAVQTWNAAGNLVMPGLINGHCHAAMTLFRGLADDLPLETWLHRHIFPAEGRWVDFDFAYAGTRLGRRGTHPGRGNMRRRRLFLGRGRPPGAFMKRACARWWPRG